MSSKLQIVEEADPACRKCGSHDCGRVSLRLSRGKMKQTYRCHECGTTFTAGQAFRQWHSAELIDFAVKRIVEGYRPKDISEMVLTRFGEKVPEGTVYEWGRRFTSIKRSRGNIRVLSPRNLIVTVRKLVPLEALAREMKASPVLVDRLLKEMAYINEPPSFLSLGWQIRRTRGARRELEHTIGVLEKVEEELVRKSDGGKNAVTLKKSLTRKQTKKGS